MSLQLQQSLGQRVSQAVSSVVTEYLLDVQPGLYKVIAADDGTDVNRYIHDPVRGRIFQHEGPSSNWNWPTLDGLGTVRGVYDDTLAEVYAADRDPYGDLIAATGSNPTPFEYTGEPEDPNGLLHLRARYYDPSLGVFNSLDPFEGPLDCSTNHNRYSWVGGNVPNAVDPSGNIPTRDEVRTRVAAYSCKCGWIDDKHVVGGIGATRQLLDALQEPLVDPNADPNVRLVTLSRAGSDLGLFSLPGASIWASIPEVILPSQLRGIALGIFQPFEERFETSQSLVNIPASLFLDNPQTGPRPSGFSEEDLTSDLLGFWLAINGIGDGTVQDRIRELENTDPKVCGDILDAPASELVFDQYEQAGWELGWENWYPRPRPASVTVPQCDSGHWSSESQIRGILGLPNPIGQERSLYVTPDHIATIISGRGTLNFLASLSDTGWWLIDGLNGPELSNHGKLIRHSPNLYLIPRLKEPSVFPKRSPLSQALSGLGVC